MMHAYYRLFRRYFAVISPLFRRYFAAIRVDSTIFLIWFNISYKYFNAGRQAVCFMSFPYLRESLLMKYSLITGKSTRFTKC